MNVRPEELALAHEYAERTHAESLTREQLKLIMDRGRELFHWYKEHQTIHRLINLALVILLLGSDYLILMRLPGPWLTGEVGESVWRVLAVSLVCGGLHSYMLYSMSIFSLHEGAAHGVICPGRHPILRAINFVGNNLCRLGGSEPGYYAEHHMSHHAKFGTEHDGEFLNFVRPRRFWLSLLPYGAVLNYTDFVAHRPSAYTKGRAISGVVALSYHLTYGVFMAQRYGALFVVLAVVLFVPHVGFFLDRLRQFSEHNLMPLDNKDGSRSFGVGFWGLLIGGGPWGSPCHWEHHLVASLPWYLQIRLHFYLKTLLTPAQKKQFLLEPVIGYPKLLLRLWTEPNRFAQKTTTV